MGGKYFDIEEAKARFADYDADKDERITLDEFMTCYLQDEEFCKQQIQNCKKMMEEAEKQKFDFELKLKEAKVFFL